MRKNLCSDLKIRRCDWLEHDLAHLWHPYTQMREYADNALLIDHASGTRVWDEAGNRYLDGMSGLWNVNLGHNRSEISTAIYKQSQKLDYYPLNGFSHVPGIELASRLVSIVPKGLTHVFYCSGGAEATETAIKMSRQYWSLKGISQRRRVISFTHGWHGCTLGALSSAGIPEEREWFGPLLEDFYQAPFPYTYGCSRGEGCSSCTDHCLEDLVHLIEQLGPETICATIVEPVQGAGGMIVPPPEFLTRIREITTRIGCHLIADEVATGFGRTGTLFAVEHSCITPDFLLCSKAITNGSLPLGAVITSDQIYEAFLAKASSGREFMHGYTFGGHPLSCAAAIATLDILLDQEILSKANRVGQELFRALTENLAGLDSIGDVRGIGMMFGVEIVAEKSSRKRFPREYRREESICTEARKRGLILRNIGNVIPVVPPLVLASEEASELADKLAEAVKTAERSGAR